MTDEEKKLIIDEDWKSQVQAEKDEAAKRKSTATTTATSDSGDVGDVPMPPASFELLLTTLAAEALVALGQVPHPATGQASKQPHQAKYLIDTLDVLRQKTQGNLTPHEQQALDNLLHQLRLVFVESASPPPSSAQQKPK